RGDINNNV
nr:Chain B, cR8 peptide from NOS2 [Homo sapiens]